MIKINNIKKVGVISDTHTPSRAKNLSEKIFNYFTKTDFIIHCGDIVSNETIDKLSKLSRIFAVKGNMDPANINFPSELIFNINEKFIICVTHGSGSPFDLKIHLYKKFVNLNPDLIIFGHTHSPVSEEYMKIQFFNPGSACCGISVNTIGIINFSSDKFITEILII